MELRVAVDLMADVGRVMQSPHNHSSNIVSVATRSVPPGSDVSRCSSCSRTGWKIPPGFDTIFLFARPWIVRSVSASGFTRPRISPRSFCFPRETNTILEAGKENSQTMELDRKWAEPTAGTTRALPCLPAAIYALKALEADDCHGRSSSE